VEGGTVPPDVTDAYLVQRAQEGYLDAFSELVSRHSARTYRVALRLLGNSHDAEDVAQDALVTAWQELPRFKADASFSTWLYRIVTTKALNRITRGQRVESTPLPAEPTDTASGPYQQTQSAHAADAVTAAVAALPPARRVAIVLYHFENLPIEEIARITGSTTAAVRSHLYRARRTLSTALADWR
jgi:RNA polymerase sigma-70 factor (ECF subfamily)